MSQARALMPQVVYCESAYDCAQGVDALVIVTEWEQFRALDLERLRDLMTTPVIIDLRNIYRPEELHRHGFAYASVGRPSDYPSFEKPVSITSMPQNAAHPELGQRDVSRGAGHRDDDFQIVTGTSTVAD